METTNLLQANIIDLLGLQALPAAKKQALLEQMGAIVEDRVMDRVLSRLDESQKKELDLILEKDEPQAVDAFLNKNAPDLATLMQEEVIRMKTEMTADLESMKAAVSQT